MELRALARHVVRNHKFSFVICMLSLLETLHWSLLAAGDANSPDFFEREVDNFRLFQSSFLVSGDSIAKLATELSDRAPAGAGRGTHRSWGDVEGHRLKEMELLEVSISGLSDRNYSPAAAKPTSERPVVPTPVSRSLGETEKGYGSSRPAWASASMRLSLLSILYILVSSSSSSSSSLDSTRTFKSSSSSSSTLLRVLLAGLSISAPSGVSALQPPAVVVSAIEQAPSPLLRPVESAACSDIQCWLHGLVLPLPDQSFGGPGVEGNVTNAVCANITIGQLASGMAAPSGLQFSVARFGISCTLDWAIRAAQLAGSGGATAQASNSSLYVSVQLSRQVSGSSSLPNRASVAWCTPAIKVSSIEFSGSLAPYINAFSPEIEWIIATGLDSVICEQLRALVQTNLTNLLQEVDAFVEPFLRPQPVVQQPPPPAGMIDLRRSPAMGVVAYLLQDVVGANGPLGINVIVNALTNGTGNVTMANLNVTLPLIPVASIGTVGLAIKNVTVAGLNSWSEFDLLDTSTGPCNLTSRTRLDSLALYVGVALNVSLAGGSTEGGYLYEEVVLEARMANNSIDSTLQLIIDAWSVEQLTNSEIAVVDCLLATVYDVNMTRLDLSFVLAQLQFAAVNHHNGTERQIDAAINHVIALMLASYGEALPALLNGFIARPARMLINKGLQDDLLANLSCIDPGEPTQLNHEFTITAFSTAGTLYVTLLLVVLVVEWYRWRERSFALLSPEADEEEGSEGDESDDNGVPSDHVERTADGCVRSKWTRSLLFSRRLPTMVRHGVLLVLLFNIALFVMATSSAGASVYVYLTLGDRVIRLPSLFEFTLGNSVRDMWNAKAYALSLIVAVFSGVWPYVKLCMVLGCWVAPCHLLRRRRREQTLMALDALGKWSLIDSFVLTLTMVAFHFPIVPPVSPHTPPGTASLDAYVEAHVGFYSFVWATMLSLAITHIALACNRIELTPRRKSKALLAGEQKWEALCTHAFRTTRPRWTWLIAITLTLLLLLAIALIGFGAAIHSFEFEFGGVFRLLLDFLDTPHLRPFSIITAGLALPESAVSPDGVGVRFIQVTWFCFAIVLPLCHQLLLLVLWLTPLTAKLQRRVFVITEVMNAWSALDVVVVSVIVALLELQTFTQFIIGDRCDPINSILQEYFGSVLGGEERCFDVQATLDDGCWLLFTACLINIAVGLLVQLTCHKVLREREGLLDQEHMKAKEKAERTKQRLVINDADQNNGYDVVEPYFSVPTTN